MKFFTVLGLIFYTIVICALAGLLISLSLHWIYPEHISSALHLIYDDMQSRQIIFLVAVFIFLFNLFFTQGITGRWQRERTIAFKMPTGEVTIALSAVEDLIKRISSGIPEIRELKPKVIAGKKNNIEVNIRLILRSETNIPDVTSRLQEMIKSRIQELGIDAEVMAKIHVAKIISHEEKNKKEHEEGRYAKGPAVPFGYGRH